MLACSQSFYLYFCYWTDPLNARAAWSSVVGVLEHVERSQKNVLENIFEPFGSVEAETTKNIH